MTQQYSPILQDAPFDFGATGVCYSYSLEIC